MSPPEQPEKSKKKPMPKITVFPEWLEVPRLAKPLIIPTAVKRDKEAKVTEPIDTVTEPIDTVTEPIDTVTEPIDTITAPEWLAEWRRMPEITIPDVDKATSIPEWLEGWLQIPGVTILEGKEPLPLQKLEKYPEPATSTVPPPAEPEPVSEELSAQPRCPHCGAVLTQEQLDFQKTGTKVLCYNCFNMI